MLHPGKMDIAEEEEVQEGRYYSLLAKQLFFVDILKRQVEMEEWVLAQAVEAEVEEVEDEFQLSLSR
jgi:hypothetical protein